MRILTANKGDPYEAVEMDIRALLSGKKGDNFLDKNNYFKKKVEIHFIMKRK